MEGYFPCEPLDCGFGVAVDVDLSRPLSADGQRQLRSLFDEHGLLVCRGQHLTRDDQVRTMSYLQRGRDLGEDPEYVANRGETGFIGTMELPFHSDSAFLPEPIAAISLHALEVIDGETSTKFASGIQGYQRLPSDLAARVDGLHTLHVMPVAISGRNRVRDVPTFYPRQSRRVVTRHPYTGRPVLYLSWVMLDGIVELEEDQSDALVAELADHLYDPFYLYEHRWHRGDVVIWDNIATLHSRDDFGHAGPRVLQRASVARWHFFDLYPEFPSVRLPHEA